VRYIMLTSDLCGDSGEEQEEGEEKDGALGQNELMTLKYRMRTVDVLVAELAWIGAAEEAVVAASKLNHGTGEDVSPQSVQHPTRPFSAVLLCARQILAAHSTAIERHAPSQCAAA
jgi:hypothetical protein